MRQWLEKINDNLSRWMQGRYGQDELSLAISITAFILLILSAALSIGWLTLIVLALLVASMFRCYSKNITKRQAENAKWLKLTKPIRWRRQLNSMKWTDRKTYRYFKCPKCGQYLRVPRNKGKIQISCKHCGEHFMRKT